MEVQYGEGSGPWRCNMERDLFSFCLIYYVNFDMKMDANTRFTIVSLKLVSDKVYLRYQCLCLVNCLCKLIIFNYTAGKHIEINSNKTFKFIKTTISSALLIR